MYFVCVLYPHGPGTHDDEAKEMYAERIFMYLLLSFFPRQLAIIFRQRSLGANKL